MGTVCFFRPFWGATRSWEPAQRLSLHLGSGCRDSSFGDLALAGPALLLFALPPFFGWVSLGPVRVCVCVCVWVCVGVCWCGVWVRGCGCLLGVGWSLDSFMSSCFFMKEPRKDFKLYVRRVFIMDDCAELIPECIEICERHVVNSEALFFQYFAPR